MNATDNEHVGRKFFNAVQKQNMEKAADYLSVMVEGRMESGMLNTQDAVRTFISSHLISAFDLSGYVGINAMEPFEGIVTSEVKRYFAGSEGEPLAVRQMLHRIMQQITEVVDIVPDSAAGRMAEIREYIKVNYRNEDLTVNDLAERFGFSVSYLSRAYRTAAGIGLSDDIHRIRILHASELLRNTDIPIKEIARAVGYTSSSAFIRSYRNIEGITPGSYRERTKRVKQTENQS